MKYLWIGLLISGCGSLQRGCSGLTGQLMYRCSKTGVEYVQSDSGTAPLYNKDGTLAECNP